MDEGENTDSIDRRKEDKRRQLGQTVPVLNLYQGRHELPYSRVFNS
jgi:urease accessory protein UreF